MTFSYAIPGSGFRCLLIMVLAVRCCISMAQDVVIDKVTDPGRIDKLCTGINKNASGLSKKIAQKTDHYLLKMQAQEERLRRSVLMKDPALATTLFGDLDKEYSLIKSKASGKLNTGEYLNHFDSLKTAILFLETGDITGGLNKSKLKESFSNLDELDNRLSYSDRLARLIEERTQFLKHQLESLSLNKEFKRYQQLAYNYKAQLSAYRNMINQPGKIEALLVETLSKVPLFQDFFAHNSRLSQLFFVPGSSGSSTAPLQGLQSISSVAQIIQSRFGADVPAAQLVQQNLQQAQPQINELKNRAAQYASGSFGNDKNGGELPGSRPDDLKYRSFLGRLQFGYNLQSQASQWYFPATMDIGLSLGYKIKRSGVTGAGVSYKLGVGKSWNNIRMTHEGIGLRSFLDWKLKGSYYLSGGYEMNYHAVFHKLPELRNYSAWQRSGLIGFSKQVPLKGKKSFQTKILWDFLSYYQKPEAQPVIFRIGYQLH